jgi:hypothetical protein
MHDFKQIIYILPMTGSSAQFAMLWAKLHHHHVHNNFAWFAEATE